MPFSARGSRGARQRVSRRGGGLLRPSYGVSGGPVGGRDAAAVAKRDTLSRRTRRIYSGRGGRLLRRSEKRPVQPALPTLRLRSHDGGGKSGDSRHAESLPFPRDERRGAPAGERVDAHHRKHSILRCSACCRCGVCRNMEEKQKKYGGSLIRPTGSK